MIFPNTICAEHSEMPPAPGYAVCVHVLFKHAPIAHYHPATSRALGEVLCDRCVGGNYTIADLQLICALCVEQLLAEYEYSPADSPNGGRP